MKEKIMNIKNILKIIISIFIIFNMVKSCSKAAEPQEWTWNDIVEFSNQIVSATEGYWQIQKDGATLIKNNNQTILNTLSSNGYNINQYNNFLIRTDNTYLSIYMYNYNSNGTISAGQNNLNIRNITGKYISLFRNNLSLTTNKQNITSIGLSGSSDYGKLFGLQSKTIGNYYYWRLENFYNYTPPLKLTFRTGTEYINVTIGNETINNVILTHKLQTNDNPIWRNNRKLQRNTYMAVKLRFIPNNA